MDYPEPSKFHLQTIFTWFKSWHLNESLNERLESVQVGEGSSLP